MHRTMLLLALVVTLCSWLLVQGCGGSDNVPGAASTGSLKLSVVFPPLPKDVRTAVIYPETNSITVDVLDQETRDDVVPRTTLDRESDEGGQVTATITAVPVGEWLVRVQGWSEEDGAGHLLSRVYDTAVIEIAQTTTKNMVMEGYPVAIRLQALPNPVLVDEITEVFATPLDAEGDTLVGTYEYEWSSSDEEIARLVDLEDNNSISPTEESENDVTADAAFAGVARGSCQIICKLIHDDPAPEQPDVTGTLELIVDPNVDEVIVNPATMALAVEASATATATARYLNEDVAAIDFTFETSDATVATVAKTEEPNTCEVTAVGRGEATINVTQPYTGASATITVTVDQGTLEVNISGSEER